MNAKKKIEEEKLKNILNPPVASREFKITIRFKKQALQPIDHAFELAKKNPYFLEEAEGNPQYVYVSFYPQDVEALHEMFNLVHNREATRLYLNNRLIPYIQELWLPLMWFYRIK
ncbi:MAG: hypothetical protein MUF15_01370 [Acidobacteria bacterium]|jgi:hypothetical protein|nr:hypothetical protein [Acidobacteriota bacterium]